VKDAKGRKSAILVLAALMSLTIPAAFSSSDSFAVDYYFNAAVRNGQWIIEDTILQEKAGEPLIPVYPAAILLPQGAEVKNVTVNPGAPVIQGGVEIQWGQIPSTFSGPKAEKVGKNEHIYNSNTLYPNRLYNIVSVESFRGFQIVYVNLYPLQYRPKSQTVYFYEMMTVEVKLSTGSKNKLYRGLTGDKTAAAGMVDNADMIGTYDSQTAGDPSPLLDPGTYQYVIITDSTLTPTFQTLLTHKANYITSTLVDIDWIYTNYTGYDNPEKVRNFIIDAYNTWGTTYCLLGGDIDVVPYRGFYVKIRGGRDPDMAADMYFGCLDGNFDADGDHQYGESDDGIDWLQEVYIGRAPVETVVEAENFVNKVIAYEQAAKPKICQFHESRVMSGNDPDGRQVAWDCEYWTPADYEKRELFEENGHISKTDWINAWNGTPLMFQHIGHGNTTVYDINYEVDGNTAWYNADMPTLINNDFWPIHMSVACITGEFEDTATDCLAEAYINDDCGAIACMMNDNYGWFSTLDASKYSGDFIETMFRALFSDGKEHIGELMDKAKSYWISAAESDGTYRWCYCEINLLGDPETPCLTQRSGGPPPDSVTITNPTSGATVSGTVDITTTVTGAIDEVRFYIDDVLKYTDTTAPFEWSWDTTQYTEGSHTVKAEGYVSGNLEDTDTVPVTVDNIVEYYVTITNPSEGQTVSGTVPVTTDTNCDEVRFYIDDVLKHTDTTAPFEWSWDTTQYTDASHTVKAEGYVSGNLEDTDTVTCTVDNAVIPYVDITNPQDNDRVSGIVLITTETAGIDTVEFYIDNVLKHTDTTAPFEYSWDTTEYDNWNHWIKAYGYSSGVLQDIDTIKVRVNNTLGMGLGLFSLLLLLIPAKIRRR
jgi:hypothetical protein